RAGRAFGPERVEHRRADVARLESGAESAARVGQPRIRLPLRRRIEAAEGRDRAALVGIILRRAAEAGIDDHVVEIGGDDAQIERALADLEVVPRLDVVAPREERTNVDG